MTKLTLIPASMVLGCVLAACQPRPDPVGAIAEPWSSVEPVFNSSGAPRILVLHDMEGLAGQDEAESLFYQFPEYEKGQQLLAADVNAVVDGLFAGGAAEVHVVDGHGSGNPNPDLPPSMLDPRATQILRPEPFGAYEGLANENEFDAVAIVGAHANTGSGGFAAHTMTLGIDVILNDRSVTEVEILALSWGRNGKPVIFASGDDVFVQKIAGTMPWVHVVTTKFAVGAGRASLRPVDLVHEELRDTARRAVQNIRASRALRVSMPIRVAVRAVPPASLRQMRDVPGLDYFEPNQFDGDAAVRFTAQDWESAVTGMFGLIEAARGGYLNSTIEQYRREGDFDAFDRLYEKRFRVWIEQESGRLRPAPPRFQDDEVPKLYHGVQ